jgi:hypothetical protein
MDENKTQLRKNKEKFVVISFFQKIFISFIFVFFSSKPSFVLYSLIFLKFFIIAAQIKIRPYLNYYFEALKITQECFFLKIYFLYKTNYNLIEDIKKSIKISDETLVEFYFNGDQTRKMVIVFLILNIIYFFSYLFFQIY